MIHYICRESELNTIAPFVYTANAALDGRLRITSYEELFANLSIDPGHLVFTDFDRLTVYELETAQAIAMAVRANLPGVRILNEPTRVLQRYPLLTKLWRDGINPFRAARLDEGFPDLSYPVFIRREDEACGPESGLLHSESELRKAIDELLASGRPLRGRLAVEYCAQCDSAGWFRKYGAFRVGERILPQHIQFAKTWVVKQDSREIGPPQLAEELDYIRTNPHEAALLDAFDRAGIEYGRMDYTMVDGRLVVYEINTNATFTRLGLRDARQERREMVVQRMLDALSEIDRALPRCGPIRFTPPLPKIHALPGPRAPYASTWRLLGKSRSVDTAILLYQKLIPMTVRQRLPDAWRLRVKEGLGRALQRTRG
jgi:hypothetical protein